MEVVKIQNLPCLPDSVKNGHLKRIRSLMLYMLSKGLDCTVLKSCASKTRVKQIRAKQEVGVNETKDKYLPLFFAKPRWFMPENWSPSVLETTITQR